MIPKNSQQMEGKRESPRRWADPTRDGLRLLPLLLLLFIASEKQAKAYTDPGTGALIWQMLMAGFVGALFYIRKFTNWFKFRKKETKD